MSIILWIKRKCVGKDLFNSFFGSALFFFRVNMQIFEGCDGTKIAKMGRRLPFWSLSCLGIWGNVPGLEVTHSR